MPQNDQTCRPRGALGYAPRGYLQYASQRRQWRWSSSRQPHRNLKVSLQHARGRKPDNAKPKKPSKTLTKRLAEIEAAPHTRKHFSAEEREEGARWQAERRKQFPRVVANRAKELLGAKQIGIADSTTEGARRHSMLQEIILRQHKMGIAKAAGTEDMDIRLCGGPVRLSASGKIEAWHNEQRAEHCQEDADILGLGGYKSEPEAASSPEAMDDSFEEVPKVLDVAKDGCHDTTDTSTSSTETATSPKKGPISKLATGGSHKIREGIIRSMPADKKGCCKTRPRGVSLLQSLLHANVRQEHFNVLQCLQFLVDNNFLQHAMQLRFRAAAGKMQCPLETIMAVDEKATSDNEGIDA